MPLEVGAKLGPYEVLAAIGAGGMGEVYRARDTSLDRDVAIKVLPDAFANDPDRLARFEREAKVLASLNHPNIGGIHGLEKSGDTRALVLELVDGPTLADRIAREPVPVDEALPIATQIAEALEAAHERGIIHRDLKPANIKLRPDGTVKVLDFGLAKSFDEPATAELENSPTITAAATRAGPLIGTAAYMSPEQAKGRPVDKRADVWAFGCVLYEMLTGRRAFGGESVSEALAAVLTADVDLTALPGDVPPSGRRLLRRCFETDPKKRLRDITDGLLQVEEGLEDASDRQLSPASGTQAPERILAQRAWSSATGLALAIVSGLAVWLVTRPEPAHPIRFAVSTDDAAPLLISANTVDVAISPDGRRIVYVAGISGQGAAELRLRPIDQLTSETLVAEGELYAPFFSPDGESVAFRDTSTSPDVLKRVSVRGGPSSIICELTQGAVRGASWGRHHRVRWQQRALARSRLGWRAGTVDDAGG